MRIAIAFAAPALVLASPAFATGGLLCKPTAGAGPWLSLAIGHGQSGGIVCASLREGGRWQSACRPSDRLTIARSWLDRQRVWLDLADREDGRDEAKLRVLVQPGQRVHTALGTLTRRGRTYKVRCVED